MSLAAEMCPGVVIALALFSCRTSPSSTSSQGTGSGSAAALSSPSAASRRSVTNPHCITDDGSFGEVYRLVFADSRPVHDSVPPSFPNVHRVLDSHPETNQEVATVVGRCAYEPRSAPALEAALASVGWLVAPAERKGEIVLSLANEMIRTAAQKAEIRCPVPGFASPEIRSFASGEVEVRYWAKQMRSPIGLWGLEYRTLRVGPGGTIVANTADPVVPCRKDDFSL